MSSRDLRPWFSEGQPTADAPSCVLPGAGRVAGLASRRLQVGSARHVRPGLRGEGRGSPGLTGFPRTDAFLASPKEGVGASG